MKKWLRRIRGSLGMGLTWAVGGFGIGGAIELVHNIWPNALGAAVDIWPAVLAFPGFLGGVAFSGVLAIAGRRQHLDELALSKVAVWGALGGFTVALVPAILTFLGLASPNVALWPLTATLAGPFMLAGAAAASASLLLARRAEAQALLSAGEGLADLGLTEEETRELLGEG